MTATKPLLPYARLMPLGDAAITLKLGDTICEETHRRVLGVARDLEAAQQAETLSGILEWTPAFCSLTVYFDPLRCDIEALSAHLMAFAQREGSDVQTGRQWRLPILFGGDHGPDLEEVAQLRQIAVSELVTLMTQTTFRVYMLGFMPGFPYMGGLPKTLVVPRLATPRTLVAERSLAIAGEMCAIYPWASPGGWRLLGRAPMRLFDLERTQHPALLASGDRVRWQAIDANRYAALEEADQRGALRWEDFLIDPPAQGAAL